MMSIKYLQYIDNHVDTIHTQVPSKEDAEKFVKQHSKKTMVDHNEL